MESKSKLGSIEGIVVRRRWSKGEASAVVAAWLASGLSAAEFGQRHKVKPERLERWRKEVRTPTGREAPPPTFAEVIRGSEGPRPDSAVLELVLRGGHVVRVMRGFDADDLRRLMQVLGVERTC